MIDYHYQTFLVLADCWLYIYNTFFTHLKVKFYPSRDHTSLKS